MYLSKIVIDRRWSRDLYQLHQALWQLFPERPDAARDFLFRVEQQQPGQGCYLLMQSILAPCSSSAATVIGSKEIAYGLNIGMPLRFKLRANPVKTIKDAQQRLDGKGNIKRCRVPLINEQAQIDWLARKLSSGAKIEDVHPITERPYYFSGGGHNGKLNTVCFEGVFTVTDNIALTELIRQGIGPAKSMGCGLLSLAPA